MNVAGIPRGRIWQLRDSHVDGFYYDGKPAGMVGEKDHFICVFAMYA